MRQPNRLYDEDTRFQERSSNKVENPCKNRCSNCILYEHPADKRMTCKIILRSYAQEFERTVNSLKQDITGAEGYGYGDACYYSWMDLMALLAHQRRFTALYGCGLWKQPCEIAEEQQKP